MPHAMAATRNASLSDMSGLQESTVRFYEDRLRGRTR
jgi:hypothetical protein